MKNNGKIIAISLAVLMSLAAIFTAIYFATRTLPEEGLKTVGLSVVYDGNTKEYTIKTDESYLLEAVRSVVEVEGQDSEYGMYIYTVDGRKADSSKEEWWCIEKNGGVHMEGISTTAISDGEHYELTLKEGYDLF